MKQKKRILNELPDTEIVKSGTMSQSCGGGGHKGIETVKGSNNTFKIY